jgi:hypothetical protein
MLKLPALLLLTLPLAAQQLEIVEATYGAGNFQMNLVQKLRGMIQNDVLDFAVDPAVLGGDPAPGSAKRLRVVYRYGGRQYETSAGDFERIRIPAAATPGPAPSPAPAGGFSLGDLWGAGSLKIVSARYGEGTRFTDVRERLQNLVRNDALSLTVDNSTMGGDPAPARSKVLEVTYEYHGATQQTTVKEGASLALPAGAAPPVTDALTPKVLRIASARYGGDNRYNDVRDRLQALVQGNSLSVKADNAVLGGDPAVGKDKVLEVTYEWSGAIYAASAKEGRTLNLPDAGAKPVSNAVVAQPAEPSGRVAESDASRTGAAPAAGGAIAPVGRAGGLRIFYARYGVTGREIDVRERLRPLLQNDTLNAVVGVDSMGADPAVGTAKTLTVIYEFKGRTFQKAVADGQALALP